MAVLTLRRWLFGDADTLAHWTPQRAAQAERDTLRSQGVVVDPVFLWSKPAQERERLAQIRRLNSWRKRTQAVAVSNVREMRRESSR